VVLRSKDGDPFHLGAPLIPLCSTVDNLIRHRSSFRNSLGGEFVVVGRNVLLKKESRLLASIVQHDERLLHLLLPDVSSATMRKVLDYCQFHANESLSERQRRQFDSEFIDVKQNMLCELASVRGERA
jgi:hypothetical protein